MPFEIPQDLHPDVLPVAFLLGQWHGNGHGDYPTIDAFEFGQEVGFTHDGRPFLHYLSRTWLVDEEGNPGRPLALETGFLRVRPDHEVELLLAHPTGFVEIYYGQVDGAGSRCRRTLWSARRAPRSMPPAPASTASSRAIFSGRSTWWPRARSCSRMSGPGCSAAEATGAVSAP